ASTAQMCTCAAVSPGMSVAPRQSSVVTGPESGPTLPFGRTSLIRSSSTTTAAPPIGSAPVQSISTALVRTVRLIAVSPRQSPRRSGSVELVQGEPEARDERGHEVAHLRKVEALDVRPQALLRLRELRVARAGLLEALGVGAELLCRAHERAMRLIARIGSEERLVARLQRIRDQPEELFLRRHLDRVIGAMDLGIELLHRRRKITRQHF